MEKYSELIREAFIEIERRELMEIEAMPEPNVRYSERLERFIGRLIERSRSGKKPFLWTARKIAALAAAILLALATITACTDNPVRRYFVKTFSDRAELSVSGEGDGLNQKYELTLLPEGFELESRNIFGDGEKIYYSCGSERIVYLNLPLGANSLTLDTENADYQRLWINGCTVEITLKNGIYRAFWHNGIRTFSLSAPESVGFDMLVDMIASTEPIEAAK